MSVSRFSISTLQQRPLAAIMELTAEKSKFNDSIFVRLRKNNRCICFSKTVWTKLSNQFDLITNALKNEENFNFELTKDFNLETLPFHGKMYAYFKKNNLYINMDENQWKDFLEKAVDILSPEDKENIPPEPSITKYLYIAEHQSPKSLFSKTALKDYAEQEGWPYTITEKKVPAPDKQKLLRLIRAYMTQKRVSALVREHCYGCQYDMPGQRDHSCLEEDVEQNYLHLVELSNVSENVGKVVQSLGLKEAEYTHHEETTPLVLDTIPEDYQVLFRETL